jgi:hypothetical protein
MIDYLCERLKKSRRTMKYGEIFDIIDIPYSHIDSYNIIVGDYCLLSGVYSKFLCVLCVYSIVDREFEVVEVTKGLEFINRLKIEVDDIIQVDFEKEIHGKNAFIYYPSLQAISLRVKYKTYRNFPKHLRHGNGFRTYRVWIKDDN